eukprot:CAMPEP_0182417924 /NCGR_PEP_ID=MMETSP1167-20130531/2382_1 /TAXON_ID=2988 /ORGANISM="Mallomonas Sp, Strain CCMP3275" /LENGTH=470 /DNA_ID=CAMNT_0024591809 /DNA_START=391 /DNA_END=1803 /DNA_ORIENTATION=+
MKKYNKQYNDEEEKAYRYNIFKINLALADERNNIEIEKGGNGKHGITKYSDLSDVEFNDKFGLHKEKKFDVLSSHQIKNTEIKSNEDNAPQERAVRESITDDTILDDGPDTLAYLSTSIDWREVYTTPIKDQGDCSASYAFATVQQIESDSIRLELYGISPSHPLSTQQLISCFQQSCDPSSSYSALLWIEEHGGLVYERIFPFESGSSSLPQCISEVDPAITVEAFPMRANTQYEELLFNSMYPYGFSMNSETEMAAFVLSTGPITVTINAEPMKTYQSGILNACPQYPPEEDDSTINHAVQLVGIHLDGEGGGYWIMRNSWGTDWGMDGYAYLPYNKNACGIGNHNFMSTNFYTSPLSVSPHRNQGTPTQLPSTPPITSKPSYDSYTSIKTKKPKKYKKKKGKKDKKTKKSKKGKKKGKKEKKSKKKKSSKKRGHSSVVRKTMKPIHRDIPDQVSDPPTGLPTVGPDV